MIILNTSSSAQQLKVIPRSYEVQDFIMSIRDDSTNITKLYTILSAQAKENYLIFANIFNPALIEGHFYDLSLFNNFNVWNTNYNFWQLDNGLWNVDEGRLQEIFKDKIFCTDQDINQLQDSAFYKLNKGQYVEYNGFDNTYSVP